MNAKHFREAISDLYATLAALAETCENESLIDYVCKIVLGAHRGPLPINFGSVIRDIEDEHRKIIFIQCILASVNHNHLSSRADHAWSMKIDVTVIQNIISHP